MTALEKSGRRRPAEALDRSHKQLTPEQKNEISERLREALKDAVIEDVADVAGIPARTMRRYKLGSVPELAGLLAIANACHVSMEWLLNGRGAKYAEYVNASFPGTGPSSTTYHAGAAMSAGPVLPLPGGDGRQYVAIPRYNIQASAGGGAVAEHAQVVEYFAFDIDFIRSRLHRDPKHLALIEARGDSMEPTIRDGDILTVDIAPNQPLQHSQLYVLQVDDNLMVKRLELRLGGSLIVHSDNPRYAPEVVPRADLDTLRILGRVLLVTTPPR